MTRAIRKCNTIRPINAIVTSSLSHCFYRRDQTEVMTNFLFYGAQLNKVKERQGRLDMNEMK